MTQKTNGERTGLNQQNSYVSGNARYWRRNLTICVFGSFTTLVSLTLLLPFLPVYVEQLGVKQPSSIVTWSGIAFGATFLGTGLTAPLWGHLGDRVGRKPMLVRAALGMAIVMSMIGLAHNVYQLVLLRLVAGLIGGYASSSMVLIATQAPPERAGWALGVLSTGSLTGNLVGPLVGGILPQWIGIRHTFFVSGGVIGIAVLATIFLVREDRGTVASRFRRTFQPSPAIAWDKTLRITLLSMFATAMLVLFSNMSIEPIITVYLEFLHVGRDQVVLDAGLVMAASALGSILIAARLGRIADRIGGWRMISWCLAAAGLTLIPQAFVTQWWQLAGLRFLLGMTLAGLLPSIAKVIKHEVPERSLGKAIGYSQSSQYAGQVLGPLMGAALGTHLGMRSVFMVTGVLLILGSLLNRIARRAARAGNAAYGGAQQGDASQLEELT